ncbi:MAG TPA: Rieske 2Fe-2S domain-containing protein [Actinomycetota bacterium]|nr:Rieske 2Fe-2S domain-containing protein [Actinomycetota bacterium]
MTTPGGDKPHAPAPSLWPVGLAVGIVCILVGLIVSWPAVAIGAAITLLFGFLWVRDVTRPPRAAEPAEEPEPAAAPAAPPLPAHRGPPAMPEPAPPGEPARYPRSKFLEGATLGLGAVIGGIVTIPVLGFAILPSFTKQGHPDINLGPISDFPEGQWMIAHFELNPREGDVSRRTAYIRANGLLEGKPSFTIISNRCAHLGCPVQPGGLVQTNQTKDQRTGGGQLVQLTPVLGVSSFTCPCHGGAYDSEGNRTAGPPVRALDRYEYSIVHGRLVLGQTYSVSHVEGTGAQAEISKYNLAGPGQHVDGPEQWFYPWQPPH